MIQSDADSNGSVLHQLFMQGHLVENLVKSGERNISHELDCGIESIFVFA